MYPISSIQKTASNQINSESFDVKQRISLEDEENLYKSAVIKFKAGDYKGAIELFKQLNVSATFNFEYIKCLAGSYHANKELYSAYFWYQYVYSLNSKQNIECLYYCGLIQFEQKKFSEAKTIFELFVSRCNSPQHSILISLAKKYIEIINLKKGSSNDKSN